MHGRSARLRWLYCNQIVFSRDHPSARKQRRGCPNLCPLFQQSQLGLRRRQERSDGGIVKILDSRNADTGIDQRGDFFPLEDLDNRLHA